MDLLLPSFLSLRASDILSQLACSYGFALFEVEQDIYLKLEQQSYLPLVLERHTPHVISLTHYDVQNGDLMSDPDVTFLVRHSSDSDSLLIYPLTITQSYLGLYQEVAFLNQDHSRIESFDEKAMASLTNFCNQWLDNIFAQGWFLPGNKPSPFVTVTTQ